MAMLCITLHSTHSPQPALFFGNAHVILHLKDVWDASIRGKGNQISGREKTVSWGNNW